MLKDRIKKTLTDHEGRVAHAYQDSKGYWTIGVGHLIDARKGGKLPENIIDALLNHDVEQSFTELDRAFSWWRQMPYGPQEALVNMLFNLGLPTLSTFKNMLASLEAGNFLDAADHALDSKWRREDVSEGRSNEVAELIRSGAS